MAIFFILSRNLRCGNTEVVGLFDDAIMYIGRLFEEKNIDNWEVQWHWGQFYGTHLIFSLNVTQLITLYASDTLSHNNNIHISIAALRKVINIWKL